MPGPGNDPPDVGFTATTFSALQALGYSSDEMAFKDGSGNFYYLFLQRKTGTIDVCEWLHATDSDGTDRPRCDVPQLTYDVIKNGTLDTQTQKISYQGKYYRIRIMRDVSAGRQIAQAIEV